MIDIKVIQSKDIMPIEEVRILPDFNPPSLEIAGVDIGKTTELIINDLPTTEFLAISRNKLLAQVPSSQLSGSLTKLRALTSTKSPTRHSLLFFEVGRTLQGLRGPQRLVQSFVKLLLQTPGTDSFNPTVGGGLLSLIGSTIQRKGTQSLNIAVVDAVAKVTDQLIAIQDASRRPIPPSEKLLTASAEGVGFDPKTTTLSARIIITSVLSNQSVANITF